MWQAKKSQAANSGTWMAAMLERRFNSHEAGHMQGEPDTALRIVSYTGTLETFRAEWCIYAHTCKWTLAKYCGVRVAGIDSNLCPPTLSTSRGRSSRHAGLRFYIDAEQEKPVGGCATRCGAGGRLTCGNATLRSSRRISTLTERVSGERGRSDAPARTLS